MLKKIFTWTGIVLVVMILGAYFAFAEVLSNKATETQVCSEISVTILDEDMNRFVDEEDVKRYLLSSEVQPVGRKIDDINLSDLERGLNQRSAIKESQVSITQGGIMYVNIIQRRPMLRIETEKGGFYIDEEGYLFPLSNSFTSYVPIISGHIPLELEAGQRGGIDFEDQKWIKKILKFGNYIDKSEFWTSQIQQVFIEKNEDVILFARVGDHTIKFGPLDQIEYKFNKLDTFYQNIIPTSGWNKYSSVDVSYSDQIICKLRDDKYE